MTLREEVFAELAGLEHEPAVALRISRFIEKREAALREEIAALVAEVESVSAQAGLRSAHDLGQMQHGAAELSALRSKGDALAEALDELADLVDDSGYEADSFTTQPARAALRAWRGEA